MQFIVLKLQFDHVPLFGCNYLFVFYFGVPFTIQLHTFQMLGIRSAVQRVGLSTVGLLSQLNRVNEKICKIAPLFCATFFNHILAIYFSCLIDCLQTSRVNSTLVIAEHDDSKLAPITLNAITAASKVRNTL